MIVEFRYEYWGNNGCHHERRLEEYDSVKDAVSDIGYTTYVNAIDEKMEIIRVIDAPIEIKQQIEEGIQQYVIQATRRARITKLKEEIRINQHWLETVDAETQRRTMSLASAQQELLELENQ